ncbi:MAG: adenylate/guanylate cyclase domain-containing protein, partial [Treponema sp.]|nr:adenylate/guanylate cyclase domain-containing protein [Treponema sp.]
MARKKLAAGRTLRPIGFKLVAIILSLSLVSLGTITALVSWMVTQDLRVTAEENNFAVNRRSAAEAEEILRGMRANAATLLNTIYGAPGDLARNAAAYFFAEHRDVAAVFAFGPQEAALFNEGFFRENGLESSLADLFIAGERESLDRAA